MKELLDRVVRLAGLLNLSDVTGASRSGAELLGEVAPSKMLVVRVIENILRSDELLERIASDSYGHPNGFDKIVLAEAAEYKLRLHLWSPFACPSDIHDHRWNFVSFLLAGFMEFDFFRVGTGGTFQEYKCSAHLGQSYEIEHVGNSSLEPYFSCSVSEGFHYMIRHDVLHRLVGSRSRPAITLVIQGKAQKTDSRVFRPAAMGEIPCLYMGKSGLLSKLTLARELLLDGS